MAELHSSDLWRLGIKTACAHGHIHAQKNSAVVAGGIELHRTPSRRANTITLSGA